MTFMEKELVIRALRVYADQQKRTETNMRKRGELKKAAECVGQSCMAEGLMTAFCAILGEPCGTVSI